MGWLLGATEVRREQNLPEGGPSQPGCSTARCSLARDRQLDMTAFASIPMSKSRPVPVLPRASCGPEPAAVRFKAACRAAGRPDRTGLDMAGPRPARGLKEALLGRKPSMLASVRPGP